MDKETLSNYGWIVICVLVLAVMLALATPFGTFIADGFKATYTGLFDTGDSALDVGLNAVGVTNTLECGHGRKESGDHAKLGCGHFACEDCGCVPASCGCENHWSGDGLDHTTVVNHSDHTYACECTGWIVPEGGTYTMNSAVNGKKVYNENEQLPCGYLTKSGDKYVYSDYTYTYQTYCNGWNVTVNDKTKTEYEEILTNINNVNITGMNETFKQCTNMLYAPKIPDTVTNMQSTFSECKSLLSAPNIPKSVTNMGSTFYKCIVMGDISNVVIPAGVTDMFNTFTHCVAITGTITINANPSRTYCCFSTDYKSKDLIFAGSSTMLQELANTSFAGKRTIYDINGNILMQ
ncbi:MAG: hypothetical protein IKY67_09470 [Paludibacteraceae bacterium]|nr:hypothetical protein [Paludibacteraceae bacterium]